MVNLLGKRLQSRYKYETADPGIIVDEKHDLSAIGFNIYIIHTSGHSKGSMSLINGDKIGIVGDAMFGAFKNSVFPPFVDELEIIVESLKKLFEIRRSLFLPSHGT